MNHKFDLKSNFSEVEKFARRHTIETFSVIAIIVAALSAWAHFFVGTLGWSVLLMAIGSIVGIFFPMQVDKAIKKIYSFSSSEKKMSEMVAEIVKIAVALFLPFIYFGYLGLMAGTSYHYYTRYVQSTHKGNKAA